MHSNAILSLLGLAFRGGRLVVGEEPVEGTVRARDARVLLLARDASDNTFRRCRHFAEVGACLWLTLPFGKEDLGRAVGRSSVAIVAVTDIGLANAIVSRLAAEDPKRYAEAAERLELKARRAAERRAEQRAHERNVRMGKYKPKQPPAPPAPEPPPPPRKPAPPFHGPKPPARRHGDPGHQVEAPMGPGMDAPHSGARPKSRPSKENRPKPRANANRYAHSRPVKKGKGSFRNRQG